MQRGILFLKEIIGIAALLLKNCHLSKELTSGLFLILSEGYFESLDREILQIKI